MAVEPPVMRPALMWPDVAHPRGGVRVAGRPGARPPAPGRAATLPAGGTHSRATGGGAVRRPRPARPSRRHATAHAGSRLTRNAAEEAKRRPQAWRLVMSCVKRREGKKKNLLIKIHSAEEKNDSESQGGKCLTFVFMSH